MSCHIVQTFQRSREYAELSAKKIGYAYSALMVATLADTEDMSVKLIRLSFQNCAAVNEDIGPMSLYLAIISHCATYLLVGCLGGLGRSLASWGMESGARRFIFLSCSGFESNYAKKLFSGLVAVGDFVQVVRGGATSRADIDGLFHSMTFEAGKQSTWPKVLGAQNLHSVFASTPLDFFIMTSSISGILAHDDAVSSIVLPMVSGIGVIAENAELEDALKRKGMYDIDEEHLLQPFEAVMISHDLEQIPDHKVVGLDPSKFQKAVNDAAATTASGLKISV
ncbi:hypothetical protein F4779DRAFT_624315 [Xylariaceae sp. FL0662B]|nr:hypothetical protein F4779DRAFT_624315 [Xylariaceae sp. FL0662B]